MENYFQGDWSKLPAYQDATSFLDDWRIGMLLYGMRTARYHRHLSMAFLQ